MVYGSYILHNEIWCGIIGQLPHDKHHNSGTINC